MDGIETRLAKIESHLRFQRRITAFLIILLVAGISYGATTPIPEVIQARRFEVVNPVGRKVVVIQSWELGGRISTYPDKGAFFPSIDLSQSDEGSGLLSFYNKAEKTIIEMGAGKVGGILNIFNNAKKTVASLGASDNGGGILQISNKDGKRLIYAGSEKSTGDGLLVVSNKDGKDLIYAGAGKSGNGLLNVKSKNGNDRVSISGGLTGGGGILVFNKTGEDVVQIHADDYGMGYVGAFNRQGKGRTLQPR